MGLAPYAKVRNSKDDANDPRFFMSGHLEDGSLCMKGGQTKGLEELERTMSDCDLSEDGQKLRLYFENLAYSVQSDLEQVVTSAVTSLLERTGHSNLIFSGGVALNSTLNGILSAHPLVGKFYVPPYPGDEGVAVGCAAFGRALLAAKDRSSMNESWAPETVLPYLGKEYTTADFMEAIESFHPWIEFQCADVSKHAAEALTSSKVVAWFNGRAEFGPRALGNRSILADPRSKSMTDLVNSVIKKRESFRPFAPTVLAEFAAQYFEDCDSESSPFMSLTKQAKLPHSIEAVVHVDGTSRLQTLKREQNPRYYDLIMEFYKLSGVPMVMNTSFNVAGEPIVESPSDAIKSFLGTEGIDFLMFPGIEIRRHTRTALSDEDVVSTACASFHSRQVQDSYGSCIHTRVSYVPKFEVIQLGSDENASEETIELIDGLELQILESIHESQSSAVLDIIVEICGSCDDGNMDMELEKPTRENVIERLLDLYRNRLILVEPGDGSELEDSITAQDKQMASTNCGVPR